MTDFLQTVKERVVVYDGAMGTNMQFRVGRARNAGEASLNFLTTNQITPEGVFPCMIRKLKAGGYRLYSRKKDARTGKRKNLGTFSSRAAAEKHERAVQYFKRA
jgi:hypothetical protein